MLDIGREVLKKIEYKNVLIALSGGVDSMVMFEILKSFQKHYHFNIEIAHFNHLTRNGQSDEDEKFVRKIAAKNDIIFHVEKNSMEEYAKLNNISSEEAGRILRHKFFNKIIESKPDKKDWFIALAHNLDDQVETILMRIIRGTGIEGLKGMSSVENNIVRPMLNISKAEIISFAENNNISYVQDLTNFTNDYTRNSIRNELIPLIKKKYNPNFYESILSLSDISSKQMDFVKNNLQDKIDDIVIYKDGYKTIFDKNKLSSFDEFTIIEMIRIEIDRIHSNYNFTKMQYNEILKILKSARGVDLILNGVIFYNSFNNFIIRKYNEDDYFEDKKMKVLKGKYDFGQYILCIDDNDKKNISLDFGDEIVIRRRKNGDRISLNNREIKLKDYLIDKKIDKIDRDILPIVEYNNEILLIENIYKKNIGYNGKASLKFIPKLRSENEQ
ncbi:tRNA lysidine(34) synthetase TilS [Helcococcus kunzii]|uniref:tRNA lysidine(34) synthetase TilS n=1 Tax=Helcococcus kunzii TaxID=40091 RepID=UPI001BB072EC|nr:tRNA lysidine(34) synthetase TilS [Helcococcus kunzii]QUY64851.1 tRNA lysidine(34) synthetase TilS [Helcococcus kunzii]QZO77293.1 tRNA lysidine(34) synthetase TilS [Helcococcus kunzii]